VLKKPVPQFFERQIATGYDTKKDPNELLLHNQLAVFEYLRERQNTLVLSCTV
jgi:hypothetical protein